MFFFAKLEGRFTDEEMAKMNYQVETEAKNLEPLRRIF